MLLLIFLGVANKPIKKIFVQVLKQTKENIHHALLTIKKSQIFVFDRDSAMNDSLKEPTLRHLLVNQTI